MENQITLENADRVKAKIVAEARGPPPEADEILAKRASFNPDILMNGRRNRLYFEWVQNTMNYYWTAEEVNTRLEQKMVEALIDLSDEPGYGLRCGCGLYVFHCPVGRSDPGARLGLNDKERDFPAFFVLIHANSCR